MQYETASTVVGKMPFPSPVTLTAALGLALPSLLLLLQMVLEKAAGSSRTG